MDAGGLVVEGAGLLICGYRALVRSHSTAKMGQVELLEGGEDVMMNGGALEHVSSHAHCWRPHLGGEPYCPFEQRFNRSLHCVIIFDDFRPQTRRICSLTDNHTPDCYTNVVYMFMSSCRRNNKSRS